MPQGHRSQRGKIATSALLHRHRARVESYPQDTRVLRNKVRVLADRVRPLLLALQGVQSNVCWGLTMSTAHSLIGCCIYCTTRSSLRVAGGVNHPSKLG